MFLQKFVDSEFEIGETVYLMNLLKHSKLLIFVENEIFHYLKI